MSAFQDAWTNFKSQVANDATLKAYAKLFRWTRKAKQFEQSEFPLVLGYPINITDEEYKAVPKQKFPVLVVSMNGKVMNEDGEVLEGELLKLDELIKNAIESDLKLTDKATIVNVGDSTLTFINDNVGDLNFQVLITVNRFTAGSR